MIDTSLILDATGLYTRIGVKEPTVSGYTSILDATAKTTKSGKTYDFYHSLANFVNIYDCQDNKSISSADVNALIANWQKEAIESGLNQVFSDQPDLLQNELLFKNENVWDNKITNEGKFVGFEISVASTDKIVNILNSVLSQFSGIVTFYLYLFHSSKKAYVSRTQVISTADDFAKTSLAIKLYNKHSSYGPGKFYIGYFQDDLGSVQAYDRIWNNSGSKTRFNGMGVKSIKVTPNGTNLFDIDSIEYASESWGLNLDISTFVDYTQIILGNQSLFDGIQGYMFAIRVLELIKTTGRMNPTQRVTANLPDIATFDLSDQSEPFKTVGLYSKLRTEVNRVRKSLFNDSRIIIGTA